MQKEISKLNELHMWSLVKVPSNKNVIKGRWVYKLKLDKNGNIDKYKARWVAKGFQQKYGVDFVETFSNTVKPMIIRALLGLSAYENFEIQQWDIVSAFPNASLDEEIYIMQPIGFEDSTAKVCLLHKALYGLKQAARQFYKFLSKLLLDEGFESIAADQSVFINKSTRMIIAAHIDDLLIFCADKSQTKLLKAKLEKRVQISDLGDISFYLGMEITRNRKERSLFLSQEKYISELMKKFNIIGQKPIYSPSIQGIHLEKNTEQASKMAIKTFQKQIGSLMYLMTATRPDLAFSVGNCARYMSNPSQEHFKALNRIWQYVRTTAKKGLVFKSPDKPMLQGFVDSD